MSAARAARRPRHRVSHHAVELDGGKQLHRLILIGGVALRREEIHRQAAVARNREAPRDVLYMWVQATVFMNDDDPPRLPAMVGSAK